MQESNAKYKFANVFFATAIGVMALGLLYFCKPVLIPIALSILLAFILNPLVNWLERRKLGRITSVLLASCFAFVVIAGITWSLASQLKSLADELPSHTNEIKAKIAAFQSSDNSTIGRLTGMIEEIFPEEQIIEEDKKPSGLTAILGVDTPKVVVVEPPRSQFSAAAETLLPIVEPLATVALVIVLVLFLLLRREDMRYRVISLMGDKALTGTTRLMRDTAERVSSYLLNLLLVNTAFGIWFGLGLYFLGVPYAVLWGALTLFFRFIPFLGSPASVLFPLLMSIATSTGWAQPIGVLAFFAVSELVTANVIEPILFGKTTGLTPIALLIAALFWAWIWGPIGLLLSTPLTVFLVVLGQHIPQLRSLKVLLAEQPVLESRLQYFQRLLAKDKIEARKVFDSYNEEFGSAKAFDDVIVPALRWTRRERFNEVITAQEEEEIWQTNNQILIDLHEHQVALKAGSDNETDSGETNNEEQQDSALDRKEADALVFGYPVHHKAEEIVNEMLQQLLVDVCRMETCTTQTLPSKAVAQIKISKPPVVVLTVMPQGGLPQAKFMCKELSKKCPDTNVIVMYLGAVNDYDSLLVSLRETGATYLTTSLAQTRNQITALLPDSKSDNQRRDRPDASSTPPAPKMHHRPSDQAGRPDEVEYVE